MAFLGETFDVNTLPKSDMGNFDPLPAGEYGFTIKSAEVKDTKDGTGKYINCQLSITGPTHAGRVVFAKFNIRNKSAQAESIGRQQLGDMMRAIGLAAMQDTDQLIGGVGIVKLAVRNDPGYGAQNDCKAFKSAGAAPAMMQQQAPQQQSGGNSFWNSGAAQQQPQAQPQANAAGRPW